MANNATLVDRVSDTHILADNMNDELQEVVSNTLGNNGRREGRRLLASVFTVFAIVLFIALLYLNRDQYQQLLNLNPIAILIIVALTLLPDRALVNYWLFRALDTDMTFGESYGLAAVTTLANQLPLAGGIMAKGLYLNQKYKLPYSTYLAASAGLFVLTVAGAGIIGIAGLVYARYSLASPVAWIPVIAFLAMMLSPIAILILRPNLSKLGLRWHTFSERLMKGIEVLTSNFELMLKLLMVSAVGILLIGIRLWAAFQLLSTYVSIEYCIVFSAATVLTQLISFAPGGLGVREGIVAAIGMLAAVDPAISVVAVGIDRILAVGTSALVAIVFSIALGRDLSRPSIFNHQVAPNFDSEEGG